MVEPNYEIINIREQLNAAFAALGIPPNPPLQTQPYNLSVTILKCLPTNPEYLYRFWHAKLNARFLFKSKRSKVDTDMLAKAELRQGRLELIEIIKDIASAENMLKYRHNIRLISTYSTYSENDLFNILERASDECFRKNHRVR
jgi:hypothetical protein